jgi:hypothetical protein
MDATLVEKITRLVLENLEEYTNSHSIKEKSIYKSNHHFLSVDERPSFHPLSKAEVDEWKAISTKIGNPLNERTSYVNPLNEEEIQTWQRISSIILSKSKDNLHNTAPERVKFFPHH